VRRLERRLARLLVTDAEVQRCVRRWGERLTLGELRTRGSSPRQPSIDDLPKSPQPTRKPSPAKKVVAKKVPAKKGSARKTPARRALAATLAATKGLVKARPSTPAPPQAPAPPAAPAPPSRTFAEKVRDCDAGTGVWFISAGSVEHASIQKRGSDGAVVIVTDAGVTEVVPVGDLFETADEARAARHGERRNGSQKGAIRVDTPAPHGNPGSASPPSGLVGVPEPTPQRCTSSPASGPCSSTSSSRGLLSECGASPWAPS
jgi:hypothetical protein